MEDHPSCESNPVGDFFREFIFQQENVQNPDYDLSEPEQYGLSPERVGAWFLTPENKEESGDNKNVLLYLHGVKGTRGRYHRLELYKVLLAQGFRILTIDYRGFGDSTDTSETEDSVVEDARSAMTWLRQSGRLDEADRLIVWGHSMGTGVATRAVAEDKTSGVAGLVLEAPYNNFTEEMIYYTTNSTSSLANTALSSLYSCSGQAFPNTLLTFFNMEFISDKWIQDICCPIMILHARGDLTIPFSLGEKLYEAALEGRSENVEFHEFDDSFGHRKSFNDKMFRRIQLCLYIEKVALTINFSELSVVTLF